MIDITKFNRAVPRYTSYPTAPEWQPIDQGTYREKLAECQETSLYVHIPFCKTMCLYCGCSVVLNRNPENEVRYVDALFQEIDLVSNGQKVSQLHFGGGTPTKLTDALLSRLMEKLSSSFQIDFSGEIAMEIDPRTVNEKKLHHLKSLGFNRVSFGVQDTNPKVQEAVKRRQSRELTFKTFELAKALGFEEINIDLIYGLPFQTPETFRQTAKDILQMRPNRIALFSYAKIPWLKAHQKAIKDETLPTTDEKFQIYLNAREAFLNAGYIAIGMDHFALADDPIAKAFANGTLHRNFQGYTVRPATNLIGLGVTSIGYVRDAYFQNVKELPLYYDALSEGKLPVLRGKVLSEDDLIRKWVIHKLMCQFTLDKAEFKTRFGHHFDTYFAKELPLLDLGLVQVEPDRLTANPLLIRNVACEFDAYFQRKHSHRFSKAI